MGSRLRKRRRIDSTIADEVPPPKRPYRRKGFHKNALDAPIATPVDVDASKPPPIHQNAPFDPQLSFTNGEKKAPAVGGLPIQQSRQELGSNGVVDSSGSRGQAMLTGVFGF